MSTMSQGDKDKFEILHRAKVKQPASKMKQDLTRETKATVMASHFETGVLSINLEDKK